MFLNKVFKNEIGSSYLQIIMASTAIAGLALVGIKLASEQREMAKNTYRQYLMSYLHQEVVFFLKTGTNCQSSFEHMSIEEPAIEGLRSFDEPSQIIYPSFRSLRKKNFFFGEEIFIENYRLLKSLKKEFSQLEVTYIYEDIQVKKKIPLELEVKEKKILNCRVLNNSIETEYSSGWIEENDFIKTNYENVSFGKSEIKGEGVLLFEGVHFYPEKDLIECDEKHRGVLFNLKGRGIRYCKDKAWYPLGQQDLKTQSPVYYKMRVVEKGSRSIVTAKHRHCFLTRIKKDHPSDGCKIRREATDIMSTFKIIAFSSAIVTTMSCEVSCVD